MSYEDHNHHHAHIDPDTSSSTDSSFTEIIRFGLIALLIVLPVRWFIAQPFIVSGASMEDTFHNNEYLIVDQVSYRFDEPKRGDVIVFKYPEDHSKYFIKRIIGLPGDTVIVEGSKVTIKNDDHPEGLTLDEPYALLGNSRFDQTVTLKKDEYFVMGDNRDHSSDSRVWGVLEREEIVGRAALRLLPPGRAAIMPGDVE